MLSPNDTFGERILTRFDKFEERIDSIDQTLIRQEAHLCEHIRRTHLLEQAYDELRSNLKPIERHISMIEGIAKFFALIAVIVGILTGVAKFFGVI
jgi:uncharacterized protein YaaN involved in tellurite resistance